MMRVLLVGSGGREHALACALAASPSVRELIAAPGNPGIGKVARLAPVKADDVPGLVALAMREQIDLVVVGPEMALAAGLADALADVGIACFGPSQAAAQLESSKAFTKDFCTRHQIPTASYAVFTNPIHAKAYLAEREPPYVLKADGLAAGKGVVIAHTRREADEAIEQIMFLGKFGSAGSKIVIEDFLPGEEVSVFALCDGKTAVFFGAAQDHKRAFDGDTGPNTGGMGAYSPAPIASPDVIATTMADIIMPTVQGMAREGAPFVGVLFAGLMVGPAGPKLIEFNARFGDPETQVLMARFEGDLGVLLRACALGTLHEIPPPVLADRHGVVVVMAAQGYPDFPLTGSVIQGVDAADECRDVQVLHAGTRVDEDGALRAAGGRVLNVCGRGNTLRAAVDAAYTGLAQILWPGGFYRRDIAWRALGLPRRDQP